MDGKRNEQRAPGNANKFIDETMAALRLGIKAKKLDPLKLENISVCNSFSISGFKKIKRIGEANVYTRPDNGYDVTAFIGFQKLHARCQIHTKLLLLEVKGTLDANITDFQMYGDISLPKSNNNNNSHPVLNEFKLSNQGDFNLTFQGLSWAGKVTAWLFPLFRTLLKHQLSSVISDLPEMLQNQFTNIIIPDDYFQSIKFPNMAPTRHSTNVLK